MVLVIVIFMKRFSLWEFLIPYSQNLKIWLDWILLKWVTNCATNCVTIATFASNGVHLEHIWRLRRVLHRVLHSAQSTSDVCAEHCTEYCTEHRAHLTFAQLLNLNFKAIHRISRHQAHHFQCNGDEIYKGSPLGNTVGQKSEWKQFRDFFSLLDIFVTWLFWYQILFKFLCADFAFLSGFTCWLVEKSWKITEELFPKLGSSQIIPKRIPSSNTFPLQLYLGHLPPRLRLSIGREKGKLSKNEQFRFIPNKHCKSAQLPWHHNFGQ